MVLAMSRRCSHCGHNGHNSRTCLDKGFKLFGVRLPEFSSSPSSFSAMRKCVSLGNLTSCSSSSDAVNPFEHAEFGASLDDYVSDDVVHTTSDSRERKKGVPWTEEEHRSFLLGLQKLGKGDWRGISRDYVKTRTPTQVASHAQKYFLRRSHLNKRRRRSSLFDIDPDMVSTKENSALEASNLEESDVCPLIYQLTLGQANLIPLAPLSTRSTGIIEEAGEMEDASEALQMKVVATNPALGTSLPSSEARKFSSDSALPFPPLPFFSLQQPSEHLGYCKIVRPTPIFPTSPVRIDNSVKISELNLNISRPVMDPSPLSFKLSEKRSRHSAFHQMPSTISNSKLDRKGNLANAISVA